MKEVIEPKWSLYSISFIIFLLILCGYIRESIGYFLWMLQFFWIL